MQYFKGKGRLSGDTFQCILRQTQVHQELPISFSLAIGPDFSMDNVAVSGSPLCTTSLLPSRPRPVPIYTPGMRGARYKQSALLKDTTRSPHGVQTHDFGIMNPALYC